MYGKVYNIHMELEVVAFTFNDMDGSYLSCSDNDGSHKAGTGNKQGKTRGRTTNKRKNQDEVAANGDNMVEEPAEPPPPRAPQEGGKRRRTGMCVLNMVHHDVAQLII